MKKFIQKIEEFFRKLCAFWIFYFTSLTRLEFAILLTSSIISVVIPPGCQKCTSQEISYCLGRDFVNDHCCCDKRYHGEFCHLFRFKWTIYFIWHGRNNFDVLIEFCLLHLKWLFITIKNSSNVVLILLRF